MLHFLLPKVTTEKWNFVSLDTQKVPKSEILKALFHSKLQIYSVVCGEQQQQQKIKVVYTY